MSSNTRVSSKRKAAASKTRIFHWWLLLAVTVAIATSLIGGNWMALHGQAGLSIVGLLSYRLVWGFVGNQHARFRNFVPGPQRLLAYLQGRWQGLGHNPLGALSVLALLSLLAAQAVTGLLGYDEIAFSGPLAALVSEETSLRLTGLHHQLANALFVLLGLPRSSATIRQIAVAPKRLTRKNPICLFDGVRNTQAGLVLVISQ